MNNAEHMRLLRKQRERAKMKQAEIVEKLKLEDKGKLAPKPEEVKNESISIRDGENGDSKQDQSHAGDGTDIHVKVCTDNVPDAGDSQEGSSDT